MTVRRQSPKQAAFLFFLRNAGYSYSSGRWEDGFYMGVDGRAILGRVEKTTKGQWLGHNATGRTSQAFLAESSAKAWVVLGVKRAGQARTARKLARAERDAKALGYRCEWVPDPEGCTGCDCGSSDCACSTGEPHTVETCLIWAPDGKDIVGSLGGICSATAEYRRVVEAELALEAM